MARSRSREDSSSALQWEREAVRLFYIEARWTHSDQQVWTSDAFGYHGQAEEVLCQIRKFCNAIGIKKLVQASVYFEVARRQAPRRYGREDDWGMIESRFSANQHFLVLLAQAECEGTV